MTFKDFKEKMLSRILWGNCLGMIVAMVAVGAGALYFLDSYTNHGEAIHMPDVKGQNIEVAMRKLEALGLHPAVGDTGYVDTLPADVVLDQSVNPETEVKPGRNVLLSINSRSVKMIALPDLADNCSLREAEMKLSQKGFKLTVPERVKGDRDWVYGIKVNGKAVTSGTCVPVKSAVTLVVGDGSNEQEFNGDDDLDYAIFKEDQATPEDEGVGVEEEAPASVPLENDGR